jgi:hypothetical protein
LHSRGLPAAARIWVTCIILTQSTYTCTDVPTPTRLDEVCTYYTKYHHKTKLSPTYINRKACLPSCLVPDSTGHAYIYIFLDKRHAYTCGYWANRIQNWPLFLYICETKIQNQVPRSPKGSTNHLYLYW